MKQLAVILFLFLAAPFIHAQTTAFEGVMLWSVNTQAKDARDMQSVQKETEREDYSEINEAIIELEQQLKAFPVFPDLLVVVLIL